MRFLLVLLLLASSTAVSAGTYQHLNLSWAANMGLADEVEGDGKGGWTDQGPGIDMRMLPTGLREFAGIPFKVLDPTRNGGRAVVVLAGRDRPAFPREAVIDAEGRRAAVVYFLHTCAWGGTSKDRTVAEYELAYSDGEKAVIPLRVGVEFTNWWDIRRGDACEVGWFHENRGVRRGVNVFAWKNPRPDVPLKTLTFRSRGRMPVPILVAVTLSDSEAELTADQEPVVTVGPGDWPLFEPASADPTGTALDVGALLRGTRETEARWWGVTAPAGAEPDELAPAIRRMAAVGCNLLRVPLEPGEREGRRLLSIAALAAPLGIRVMPVPVREGDAAVAELEVFLKTLAGTGTEGSNLLEASLFTVGVVDERARPEGQALRIATQPSVMDPAASFVARLAARRRHGSPYLALYSGVFPAPYGAERPLLAAAVGALQGWDGCAALENLGPGWGAQAPEDLGTQPVWMIHMPAAALAFRRGDLKEARTEWICPKDGECGSVALVRRSGWKPGGPRATDNLVSVRNLLQEKIRKVVSETGQLAWQGNIGLVQIQAPRFQAVLGFLAHRRLKGSVWDVECSSEYAALTAVSLTKEGLQRSRRILLSASARAVNSGMAFSPDRTRCMNLGKGPVHLEPVRATLILHRWKPESGLNIQALDASGKETGKSPKIRWFNNDLYVTWPAGASHLVFQFPAI